MNVLTPPPPCSDLISENRSPVLMTASISTHGMAGACFADAEREEMYLSTLEYYGRTMPSYRFVFAENSGWNLLDLKNKLIARGTDVKNFEFVQVPFELCDNSRGKGYNELVLMKEAVRQSRFIAEAGSFFKVTGRYPIYNLAYFVDRWSRNLSRGHQLYCDVKDHKLYDILRLGWNGHSFESRLYGCTVECFDRLFYSKVDEVNDYNENIIETAIFNSIKEAIEDGQFLTNGNYTIRFEREPHIGGLGGHIVDAFSFSQNNDDIKSKIKRIVGNGIRTFLPFFKF